MKKSVSVQQISVIYARDGSSTRLDALDLCTAFPEMVSSTNYAKFKQALAAAWPDEEFVHQACAQLERGGTVQAPLPQLPWRHHCVLLDKLQALDARLWYAAKAIEHRWSRSGLVMQIETRLLERNEVKHPQAGPTIGLLLCKSKNKVVAEYALRDKAQPLGVAEYQLVESLPPELPTSLPSIEQIERELTDSDLLGEEESP